MSDPATATGGTMEWFFYAVAFPVALLLLASAAFALYWASRHGQLRNLERGAKTIFDDKEPIGVQTDFFPGKKPSKSQEARHTTVSVAKKTHL